MDVKFINAVKDLLREGKDLSVQQILRESLDAFEKDKATDENLAPLLEMWKKEKVRTDRKLYGSGVSITSSMHELWLLILCQPTPRPLNAPPYNPNQQNYFARNHHRHRGLPPPDELAARIEEAKTSAKLLLQVVQSTPASEILNNDLIKEFAERCQSASRSVQGYINSDNPAPDEDTLLTLIETNDQLSVAMSKHQRAILQARRAVSSSPTPNQTSQQPDQIRQAQSTLVLGPPPVPPPRKDRSKPLQSSKPSLPENPFADPQARQYGPVDMSNNQSSNPQPPSQDQHFEPPPGPPPQQQQQQQRQALIQPPPGPFRPTASYVGRQDSAANHMTMHGASPPIVEEEQVSKPGMQSSPISPVESREPGAFRY